MSNELAERIAEEIVTVVPVDSAWTVTIGTLGIKLYGIRLAADEACAAIRMQISAIIARHLSTPQPVGEWLPIDSAPKDSSWILGLMRNGRSQAVIRWGGGTWEDDSRLCRDPIRWMPLPDATVVQGESGTSAEPWRVDPTHRMDSTAAAQGEGDAQPRNILKFDRPKQSCCDALLSAENAEYIGFTERGVVLMRDEEILADISFCPFCGARIMPKGSYV